MRAPLLVFCLFAMSLRAFAADIESLHERAEELIAVNDFRGAVRVYSDIVLAEPDDSDAYADMGRCYMILGDFDRVEDSFKNALHIDPSHAIALEGLVRIHDPDMDRYFTDKEPEIPDTGPGYMEKEWGAPARPAEKPAPLIEPFSARPLPSAKTLKRQKAQRALKNAGAYDGPIDGSFGPQTKLAIQHFQMEHGLIPDGVIGPKTWGVLKEYE